MFDSAVMRSIPRAQRDPIRTMFDALLLVMALVRDDARDETMVIVLDDERRGIGVVNVVDCTGPDAVLVVMDRVVEASQVSLDAAGFVVASIRPADIGVDDLARWHDLDATCDDAGLELLEWFVVGDEVRCPRTLCGVTPRWST